MSFNNSMLPNEAINLIITNSCKILNCDRTSVFVIDNQTNLLVVHSSKGLSRGEIKLPCDKGIIGHVFTSGEKLKIDDAYLDKRFNDEIDIITNYITKSILCVPLRDEDGNIFGVIQSINKNEGLFNPDDEELMEFFAIQVSSILRNSINYDQNLCHNRRLKILCEFSVLMHDSNLKIEDLTNLVENLIMKIWNINLVMFYIFDSNEKNLYQITKYERKQINFNNGLIAYVCKNKELHAIKKADDSPFYNSLVDIETGYSIITFPILNLKNKKLALVQMEYPYKLNSNNKPKQNDMSMISMFSNIISFYLESKESINFY